MQTDFFTQLPFGVTQVKATAPTLPVKKEYVKTAANVESSSRSSIDERAKRLENELDSINQNLKAHDIELNFSRDDKTGIVVLKLIDSKTGDSLKQIPSEVSLKLAEVFSKLQIHLFSSEV